MTYTEVRMHLPYTQPSYRHFRSHFNHLFEPFQSIPSCLNRDDPVFSLNKKNCFLGISSSLFKINEHSPPLWMQHILRAIFELSSCRVLIQILAQTANTRTSQELRRELVAHSAYFLPNKWALFQIAFFLCSWFTMMWMINTQKC